MNSITSKIQELKKEKDAVILAHYYTEENVQALADHVGDSYYLSKIATKIPNRIIVFCGVSFMGESAKILNPEKTILMPDASADCPMAHMAKIKNIQSVKNKYKDLAVVCYINSTAEIKAYSDVCVTSSNALKIINKLPQKNIYFIPDANLGRYVARFIPDKNFIFSDGYCHVHTGITAEAVKRARNIHTDAKVLAHPECTWDVLTLADYVGSTSGIIEYATTHEGEFIICTEPGILYKLKQKNPNKVFHLVGKGKSCIDMKKITLQKVADTLEKMQHQVELDETLRQKAFYALANMLELAE
ncbi:MAG: quinolinate synthase NadA [Eubacteriales bacterium]|nr:quinolinate synthase NadA [Eubacteriales bacterium]